MYLDGNSREWRQPFSKPGPIRQNMSGYMAQNYQSRLREPTSASSDWHSSDGLKSSLFPDSSLPADYPAYSSTPQSLYPSRFPDYHSSDLHTNSVFQRDRPHADLPLAPWSEANWNSNYLDTFYDFNDVNHSFYGLEDQFDGWDQRDDFWVNSSSQQQPYPSQQPSYSSRNVFGFSDSTYLDPLDCEGMSCFNTSCGIYAPRPSLLKNTPPARPANPPPTKPSPPSASTSISTLPPPFHLSHLWLDSVYRSIWDHFDFAKKQRLLNASGDASDSELIKRRVEAGIQEKKFCRIRNARSVFIELVITYGSNIQVWLEFCRLEMECGDYLKARCVLETACSLHPRNEVLLQKRLRVEERLRSVENVVMIINELRLMDTQKSMKITVEGVTILSKLGYEKMGNEYRESFSTTSKYFTGNLYLELMLNEQRSGVLANLVKMIGEAFTLFPKYGPLWFFCFTLKEHLRFLGWNRERMSDLMRNDMDVEATKAAGNLTTDLLWRVFLTRIEYWYRCCMYLREATFDSVRADV